MRQQVNSVYEPLFRQRYRYVILMGGRGAGRSTVASQYANAKLVADGYFRCAIMRYVLGDIRNSIYREIVDRAEENEVLSSLHVNDSQMTIEYGANSINAVGFKKSSSDQKAKLKSLANYNCVIVEEADEIPEADFMQLDDSLRTLKGEITVILLLNPPPRSHWIINRFFDLEPSGVKDFYIPKLKVGIEDTLFIHSNYRDNIKNIAFETVRNYQAYEETNPQHFYNMVEGLVPEVVRGKIYSNWRQIDEVPHEAVLERYGLDFGYTNDPTAIIGVYRYNGGLVFDEVTFAKGLQNHQIAAILNNVPKALVVADSAEPKSIDDLKMHGVQVVPAKKGPDSIKNGISLVQEQPVSVTRHSTNLWNEYNNYAWFEDKDGTRLNEPRPGYDHGMDAVRYAVASLANGSAMEPVAHYSGARPYTANRVINTNRWEQ